MPEETQAENSYAQAEQGWLEMVAGAAKIQAAANKLKKTERSIDGYNIERALLKHKPEQIQVHLEGLREHRRDNKL